MKNGKSINNSIKEYTRGIVGGLLFSFPLLYTMEMWWTGFSLQAYQMLLLMLSTYILLLGYNRYAGMHPGAKWKNVFIDSVEEMGIGLILSLLILLMLNRIPFDDFSIQEILGKVLIEAMAISIGVSIGTAQLGDNSSEEEGETKNEDKESSEAEKEGMEKRSGKMAMVVLALCGSIIIGGNVAPTEEIIMIATESEPLHILIMAIASILLSLVVTYYIDFKGTVNGTEKATPFQITFDTGLSYAIALLASALLLWFFGRFVNAGFIVIIYQIVVLGVIASLGASAGRLLIK